MRYCVCAVFDSAVQAYMTPLFFRTRGEAMRAFKDAVRNKEAGANGLFAHPEDYEIRLLGAFDDGSGLFELTTGECLLRGVDAKDMT